MNRQGLGLTILLVVVVVLWLAVVLLAGQVAELQQWAAGQEQRTIRLEQSSDWYDEWIRSLEIDVDFNTLRTGDIMRRLSEKGIVWG